MIEIQNLISPIIGYKSIYTVVRQHLLLDEYTIPTKHQISQITINIDGKFH